MKKPQSVLYAAPRETVPVTDVLSPRLLFAAGAGGLTDHAGNQILALEIIESGRGDEICGYPPRTLFAADLGARAPTAAVVTYSQLIVPEGDNIADADGNFLLACSASPGGHGTLFVFRRPVSELKGRV